MCICFDFAQVKAGRRIALCRHQTRRDEKSRRFQRRGHGPDRGIYLCFDALHNDRP
jgi:hypothetical protein